MSTLKSAGRPANTDRSVVRQIDISNRFTETQVDLAYVDSAIDARASALALKSYVDNQDAKYPTPAQVDNEDNKYVLQSSLNAASGVPTLDSSGLIQVGQIPSVRPDRVAQWYGITRWYLSGATSTGSTADTAVRICEITYSDPGYTFAPWVFGSFLAKGEDSTTFGSIYAKHASGNVVGAGHSSALVEWHSVSVAPFSYAGDNNNRSYTGGGVITIYGSKYNGNANQSFSSVNGFAALVLVPLF